LECKYCYRDCKEFDICDPCDLYYESFDLFSREHYNLAMETLDTAIRLDPNTMQPWGLKGVILHIWGRNKQALVCVDTAIRLDPDNGLERLLPLKTTVLHYLNRNEEALACFYEAIKVDPGDVHYLEYSC